MKGPCNLSANDNHESNISPNKIQDPQNNGLLAIDQQKQQQQQQPQQKVRPVGPTHKLYGGLKSKILHNLVGGSPSSSNQRVLRHSNDILTNNGERSRRQMFLAKSNNRSPVKSTAERHHRPSANEAPTPTTSSRQQYRPTPQSASNTHGDVFLSALQQQSSAKSDHSDSTREHRSSTNIQQVTNGPDSSLEVAECYEEIDQIYDYIRGLAPLPLRLRSIKSIDFEQIERNKRKALEKQQRLDNQQASGNANTVSNSSKHSVGSNNGSSVVKPTKVRQRDGADGASDQLKQPESAQTQGPLPIRLTISSTDSRANVKQVESLSLASRQPSVSATYLKQLAAPQRARLFRLPRAHSTSTITKSQEATNILARIPAPTDERKDALDLIESFVDEDSQSTNSSSASRSNSKDSISSTSLESSSEDSPSDASTTDTSTTTTNEETQERSTTRNPPKWTDGFVSDYENELASHDANNKLQKAKSCGNKLMAKQSGPGGRGFKTSVSGGIEVENFQCRVRDTFSSVPTDSEHIYEQIPAHKNIDTNATKQRNLGTNISNRYLATKHNNFNHVLPHTNQTNSLNRRLAGTPLILLGDPVNQQLVYRQQHRAMRAYPVPILSAPNPAQYPVLAGSLTRRPQVRPLTLAPSDHRMSMGNLQLIAKSHQKYAPLSTQQQFNRSQSSSKVNRAPKLSPGQLIGQIIQVPRVVSKRRQFLPGEGAAAHGTSSQAQPVKQLYVWQQANQQVPRYQRPSSKQQSSQKSKVPDRQQQMLIANGNRNRKLAASIANEGGPTVAVDSESRGATGGYSLSNFDLEAPLIDDDQGENVSTSDNSSRENCEIVPTQNGRNQTGRDQKQHMASNSHLKLISNNHSFSSSSASSLDSSSHPLSDSEQPEPNTGKGRPFEISRSFIKCYYGNRKQEKQQASRDQRAKSGSTSNKPNRRPGEKLLSLIGLNTNNSAAIGSKKSVRKERSDKFSQQPEIAANSDEPIKDREQRIVRHFEHPTIRVNRVPSGIADESDSTSSYEAAIKNSRQLSTPIESTTTESENSEKRTSSRYHINSHQSRANLTTGLLTGQQLIKVPKLSKQSHLLNRPLPRPPASGTNHQRATPVTTSRRNSAASNSVGPTLTSGRVGQRTLGCMVMTSTPVVSSKETPKKSSKLVSSVSPASSGAGATMISPNVTCTSSGISSRLTIHKSPSSQTSGSSARRSGSSSAGEVSSRRNSSSGLQTNDFALMDADEELDEVKPKTRGKVQENHSASIGGALPEDKNKHPSSAERQQSDEVERLAMNTSNLKLFDENFSVRFRDKLQVASSNDSLLESIDFSSSRPRSSSNQKRPLSMAS